MGPQFFRGKRNTHPVSSHPVSSGSVWPSFLIQPFVLVFTSNRTEPVEHWRCDVFVFVSSCGHCVYLFRVSLARRFVMSCSNKRNKFGSVLLTLGSHLMLKFIPCFCHQGFAQSLLNWMREIRWTPIAKVDGCGTFQDTSWLDLFLGLRPWYVGAPCLFVLSWLGLGSGWPFSWVRNSISCDDVPDVEAYFWCSPAGRCCRPLVTTPA